MNKVAIDDRSAVNVMQLVETRRRCGFCGKPMSAIELWHGCPHLKLAVALATVRGMSQRRRVGPVKIPT